MIEPPALPLVRDGRILHRNLRREFITIDELRAKLREHGVEDVAEVKTARLESDGEISVLTDRRRVQAATTGARRIRGLTVRRAGGPGPSRASAATAHYAPVTPLGAAAASRPCRSRLFLSAAMRSMTSALRRGASPSAGSVTSWVLRVFTFCLMRASRSLR